MSTCVAISVVIAAHNEEDVLGRCLDALLPASQPRELEIVVVCNGCTDRTADVAREYGNDVRVIETPKASKTAALNLGDASCLGFSAVLCRRGRHRSRLHRCGGSPRRLAEGDALAASPVMDVDLRGSSLAVRAYYRIWERLAVCPRGHDRRRRVRALGGRPPTLRRVPRGDRRRRIRPHRCSAPASAFASMARPVRVYAPGGFSGSRTHQDPEPPRPVPAQAALPRPRRGRADDEVLPQRDLDDRRSTVALAGRDVLRGRRSSRSRRRARRQLTSIDDYVWERDRSSRRPDRALNVDVSSSSSRPRRCPG